MAPSSVRALHYAIKAADRTATINFLTHALGMRVLRHEEFQEGCKAACNGRYDGMWSKTMVGFADEDSSFVLELTYNYGVPFYRRGNELGYLKVRNRVAFKNLEKQGLGREVDFNVREVASPDSTPFMVLNEDPADGASLASICLSCTDLDKSTAFWGDTLGLLEVAKGEDFAVFSAGAGQATLRLKRLPAGVEIDLGTGYGRVAFSCPTSELQALQDEVLAAGHSVLTPLVSLDTPGKATVQVVILADPDGHEVCFVGDEGFRKLSQPDDNAQMLLSQAMAKDHSREWRGSRAKAATAACSKPAAQAAGPAAAAAAAPGGLAPGVQ